MRSLLGAIVLCLFISPGSSFAQPEDHPVKAQLLADVTSIKAGQPFHVGVRLTLQPGWHVYWLNPGDSGQPPEVTWKLPDGFTVSELEFPVPKKFDQPGDMIGYGYEDQVLLIATVTPPRDLKPGTSVTLEAQVWWLVCEDVCIPGEAKLSVTLPVSTSAAPSHADVFEQWRARMPRKAAEVAASVHVNKEWGKRELRVTVNWQEAAPQNIAWFPPASDQITFSNIRIESDGRQTRIVCNFAPLAGRGIPPETMDAIVAYDAGEGARRGLTVPFDLQQQRDDIFLPTD